MTHIAKNNTFKKIILFFDDPANIINKNFLIVTVLASMLCFSCKKKESTPVPAAPTPTGNGSIHYVLNICKTGSTSLNTTYSGSYNFEKTSGANQGLLTPTYSFNGTVSSLPLYPNVVEIFDSTFSYPLSENLDDLFRLNYFFSSGAELVHHTVQNVFVYRDTISVAY